MGDDTEEIAARNANFPEKPLKITVLSLQLDMGIGIESASKLRGFIGNFFKEYPILHHHVGEFGYLYEYPRVQYKVIDNQPIIVGIDAREVLSEIASRLERLDMDREYRIISKTIREFDEKICPSSPRVYEFITPWIALNEENYKKYGLLPKQKRQRLLSNILVGNVLSMCKSLSYRVERRLRAATFVREARLRFKGLEFVAFTGRFIINFEIPSFLGLGKGVSQGFGTIKKVEL